QEEDKKRRDLIEARNIGDSMAYQAEKTLGELGEKVPAEIKTEVDEKVTAVREALATEDTERIKQATNDLSTSLQKIGQAMYAQEQATAGTRGPNVEDATGDGASEPGTEKADEGTVEGEFREV
ncbi:MAG TPA: Hsp70 family protein, partial [Chloroflexia bacterium]|nr:Hsp70 family protein [Chloroflexia bacterium]